MNCEDFENNVIDLAREQIIDTEVRVRALAHRDECAACALRLADESALSFKLRALAADGEAGEAPVLSDKVLAALRERQATLIVETSQLHSRFRTWAVAATATAAVAALVLIAMALGFMRAGSPAPLANGPSDTGHREIVKKPEVVAGTHPGTEPPKDFGSKRGTQHLKSAVNRSAKPATTVARAANKAAAGPSVTVSYSIEVATDFFPVGYGSAPNLGDGGQLVRLELPRSALVAFGVPMNVDRYGEKVKAEVLFGVDGMAHAIRFVQ